MNSEFWMPIKKHKYIIEHCKCTAQIATYLYFNRCGISKDTLISLALMHDCLKFVSVEQTYIKEVHKDLRKAFHKKYPNTSFGKLPNDLSMSYTQKSSAHSAYPNFNIPKSELFVKAQDDFMFSTMPTKKSIAKCNIVLNNILPYYHDNNLLDDNGCTLLDIVVLTHMVSPNFSKQLPVTKFFELNLAISFIHAYLLAPIQRTLPIDKDKVEIVALLICICDILDACTKQSGDTKTVFDKQPVLPINVRNKNFLDTINKIHTWLTQPCMQQLYSKKHLGTISYKLKQLSSIGYETIEKEALNSYKLFDIKEMHFD